MAKCFTVSLILFLSAFQRSSSIALFVNSSVQTGDIKQFWRSTGFCPPKPHQDAYKFDLSGDMRQNLALIGAIPHSGIEQVRIHWLLDLVTVSSMNGSIGPVYDFAHLDDLIDLLYQLGLKPGFELMGNPSGFFKNFDDKTFVYYWKDLVAQLAKRYIDEYGLGWVMNWNFETWNEPDCRDFDTVHMTVKGFLNYYDACSEGLKEASPLLKFGGPGDGCLFTEYSDALLDHVVNGTNYFTGEKGIRIDYLSYHKKGSGSSQVILDDEIFQMKKIVDRQPSLADKPFFNDEADPLVGWSKDEVWRADSTYAAMVTKVIAQHQNTFFSNPSPPIKNYSLLSNDNAFLSWYPHQFTERTLLARFQMNNTSPPHTQFFQKPVYSAMGLLAVLGEKQVHATLSDTMDEQLGVLASIHEPRAPGTSDSWQLSILMYYSNDTGTQSGHASTDIMIDLQPPETASTDLIMALWLLDNANGNPYSIWVKEGRPDFPSLEHQKAMREQEGAYLAYTRPVKPGYTEFARLGFNEPGIALVHICSKPSYEPDQVNNVAIFNITAGQVLITWSDKCVNSRCILTYEVVYSKTGDEGTYTTVTDKNRFKFTTAFVYAPTPQNGTDPDDFVRGFYKVRAIDYWSKAGAYSLPTPYPDSFQQA